MVLCCMFTLGAVFYEYLSYVFICTSSITKHQQINICCMRAYMFTIDVIPYAGLITHIKIILIGIDDTR